MATVKDVAEYYEKPARWKLFVYSPVYFAYFKKQRIETIKLILKYVKPSKKTKLMDAGCGYGRYTEPLSRIFDVYAVDISRSMLEIVKKYTGKTFLYDISKTKFKKDFFDVVICLDVTNHIESLDSTIAEFHRVLKNGGFLVINITNPRSFWRPTSILIKNICNLFRITYGTPISKYFTISQLENTAKGKFKVIETIGHKLINFPTVQPVQNTVILQKI